MLRGYSQRSIEASVRSSHQTVKAVLDRAQELNMTCPIDSDVTNEMLDELFCGSLNSSTGTCAAIDFEYIHRELSKKGVTLTLLWQEYFETAYTNGEKPYMADLQADCKSLKASESCAETFSTNIYQSIPRLHHYATLFRNPHRLHINTSPSNMTGYAVLMVDRMEYRRATSIIICWAISEVSRWQGVTKCTCSCGSAGGT